MKNIILFDKKTFIVTGLFDELDINLKDNIYNDNTYYCEVSETIFQYCLNKAKDNSMKFISNPLKVEINIDNIEITPRPKYYTKEQILAKAIMENDLMTEELKHQTNGLATGVMENVLSTMNLKKQIKALSTALFEMSLKK